MSLSEYVLKCRLGSVRVSFYYYKEFVLKKLFILLLVGFALAACEKNPTEITVNGVTRTTIERIAIEAPTGYTFNPTVWVSERLKVHNPDNPFPHLIYSGGIGAEDRNSEGFYIAEFPEPILLSAVKNKVCIFSWEPNAGISYCYSQSELLNGDMIDEEGTVIFRAEELLKGMEEYVARSVLPRTKAHIEQNVIPTFKRQYGL